MDDFFGYGKEDDMVSDIPSALTPESVLDKETEVSKEGVEPVHYRLYRKLRQMRRGKKARTKDEKLQIVDAVLEEYRNPKDAADFTAKLAGNKEGDLLTALAIVIMFRKNDKKWANNYYFALSDQMGPFRDEVLPEYIGLLNRNDIDAFQAYDRSLETLDFPAEEQEILDTLMKKRQTPVSLKMYGERVFMDDTPGQGDRQFQVFDSKDDKLKDQEGFVRVSLAKSQYQASVQAMKRARDVYRRARRTKASRDAKKKVKKGRTGLAGFLERTGKAVRPSSKGYMGENEPSLPETFNTTLQERGAYTVGDKLNSKEHGRAFHKLRLDYEDQDIDNFTKLAADMVKERYGIDLNSGEKQEDGSILIGDRIKANYFASNPKLGKKKVVHSSSELLHSGDSYDEGGLELTVHSGKVELGGTFSKEHPDDVILEKGSKIYVGHLVMGKKVEGEDEEPVITMLYFTDKPVTNKTRTGTNTNEFAMVGMPLSHNGSPMAIQRTIKRKPTGEKIEYIVETRIHPSGNF